MDENTYNKLSDQDDKSSSSQEIEFIKGFRQKFADKQPQNTTSSKFINPRKQNIAQKSARED